VFKDKATLFNAYFSSVFRSSTTGSKSGICDLLHPFVIEELSNITLNAEEVARSLCYLDTSKACGPDGIPTRLLQECSFQIAPSICELFNHSLHTGQIPSEWKSANVTPSTRKIVNNQQKIIDLFLCFSSSEKFWNLACVSDFMIMSNIFFQTSYNNCIKEAGTPQQLNTNYSGPFTKYQYKYRKQK
jgi:hypothetical protein